MALVILAHPNYELSVANKTIINELEKTNLDLEIRDIFKLNQNYKFDITAEQNALLRHDLIILQYPMYWYSVPAILKAWFDQVFTYQFAYGSNGDKLKNKKLLISLTIGQPEKNFTNNDATLQNLLLPIKNTAKYSQMDYLTPIALFDIATVTGNSTLDIINKAKAHSLTLINAIDSASN